MKRLIIFVFLLCIVIVGCPMTPTPDNSGDTIAPSSASALSNAISISGGNRVNGDPPSPSTSSEAPRLTALSTENRSITATNGSAVELPSLGFMATNNVRGVYIQVEGANNYFNVQLSNVSPVSSGNVVTNPLVLPRNLSVGTFTLLLSIYDSNELVSNVLRIQITITIQTESSVHPNMRLAVGTWRIPNTSTVLSLEESGLFTQIGSSNPAVGIFRILSDTMFEVCYTQYLGSSLNQSACGQLPYSHSEENMITTLVVGPGTIMITGSNPPQEISFPRIIYTRQNN